MFGIILILVYLEYSSVRILTILGGFAAVSFRIFPSLNRITTSYQMIKTHRHLLDILYDNLKDDNQDLEDDYLSSKKDNNASSEKKKSTEHQVSKSCDIDKEVKKEMLEKASTNKSLLKKKEAGSTSKKPEKSIVPPPGWFFPSWFSFITPFTN